MAKYFRKRSSSRFRKRYSRKTRFRRAKPGTKTFFRKQRKWNKPEIKWITNDLLTEVVPTQGIRTGQVLPSTIPVGAGVNQRTGNCIKSRKVMVMLEIDGVVPNPQTGNRPDGNVRVIFWTPRRMAAEAIEYMNGRTPISHLDWNVVRTLRDVWVPYSAPNFILTVAQENFPIAAGGLMERMKRFIIPHPRNMDFGQVGIDQARIDPNRDQLYVTYLNTGSISVSIQGSVKMTYIDN